MLKKIFVLIFVFILTVAISGFLYGSMMHLIQKTRAFGLRTQMSKYSYYAPYQEDIKLGLLFTFFSAVIYFIVLQIISPNQRSSLLRRCIIASIAALSFIVFIVLATYGFSSFNIISILLLLVVCIVQGTLIALIATILNKVFNRIVG